MAHLKKKENQCYKDCYNDNVLIKKHKRERYLKMDPLKTKGIVFIILVLKTLHQMLSISMVV